MMHILTSLVAILLAMITLILINGSEPQQSADKNKLYIPIEDETDQKKSD